MYFIDNYGNKFSCDFNFSNCKTLVISGGAFKCVYALGALAKILSVFKLKFQNFAGTSSGAIICFLISIGYSPIEIVKFIFNINESSPYNIRIIRDFAIKKIEELMIIKGFPRNVTFIEHHRKTNTNLMIIATNVSRQLEEVFSYKTSPDMEIRTAIALSCSLPIIFPLIIYKGSVYIDGIFSNNFPIKTVSKIKNKGKVLALSTRSAFYPNHMLEFYIQKDVYKIVHIPDKIRKYFFTKRDDIFCMYMIGYNFISKNIDTNRKNRKRRDTI